MKFMAVIGAGVGAIIGALVWAYFIHTSHRELASVALAMGGVIGFGAAIMGGRGYAMGIVCALLTLLAIFMGKVYGFASIMNYELEQSLSRESMFEAYEEMKTDARDFVQLKSEEEYPQFMVDHGYTDATSLVDLPSEDISDFKVYNVPQLITFNDHAPEFESWSAQQKAEIKGAFTSNGIILPMVINDLGLMDILFALIGIATAFMVGSGRAET